MIKILIYFLKFRENINITGYIQKGKREKIEAKKKVEGWKPDPQLLENKKRGKFKNFGFWLPPLPPFFMNEIALYELLRNRAISINSEIA